MHTSRLGSDVFPSSREDRSPPKRPRRVLVWIRIEWAPPEIAGGYFDFGPVRVIMASPSRVAPTTMTVSAPRDWRVARVDEAEAARRWTVVRTQMVCVTAGRKTWSIGGEREVKELRRANEILRKASAYFAQAELDRRPRR